MGRAAAGGGGTMDRAAAGGGAAAAGRRPALLLFVPLLVERAALAGATADATVVWTGMGRRRALAAAGRGRRTPADAVAVAGFCGSLTRDLRAGDIVVASSLRAGRSVQADDHEADRDDQVGGDQAHGGDTADAVSPWSGLLVAALRARGLTRVHSGLVVSSPRVVRGPERARLAARGAIAADMESAWLSGAAAGRPFAVLRVVVDTPATRLARPLAAARGLCEAGRTLRRAVPALADWARAAGLGAVEVDERSAGMESLRAALPPEVAGSPAEDQE